MGKATIIEAQNSNTVYENGKAKGILGKLKGIFADYKHGTRNSDRLYTEELWDNRVFGSEDVMEALKTKTLFGELDHPEGDRNETLAQNAAISITKLEKRPEEGVIYGEAEILDTPTGRIVKALADSGAQLGISSRGLGEEIYRNGKNIIDPETYDFITFDVVVTPANRKARVSLEESKHESNLTKTIEDGISKSKTVNQLNQIRKVIESVPTDKKDNLLKLIESKHDIIKEKHINSSKISEANKNIALKLINKKYEDTKNELEESKKYNESSKKETISLIEQKEYLTNSKKILKRKLKETILDNRNKDTEISNLKAKIESTEVINKDLHKSLSGLNEKVTELYDRLDTEKDKNKRLIESNTTANNKITELESKLNKLNEQFNTQMKQKDEQIKQLTESNKLNNTKLEESKTEKQNEINNLNTKLSTLQEKYDKLKESYSKYNKLSFEPLGTASLLNESIEEQTPNISDDDRELYNFLVNMYTE